jgi:acetolactate synthase I/II/III large subunit
MKLSDYIADFLSEKKISHVYVLQGGAAAHLIDSLAKNDSINYICMQHEQACAMAADAQARVTGDIGVAVTTSGPGATNLITGICSAYYDSIPVVYITGQVSTSRNKGDTGVRQIGFQETEIVPMVETITNYAVYLNDPHRIRYELEKAFYLAKEGRAGPVLIDVPDDFQREQVNPDEMESFIPPPVTSNNQQGLADQIERCIELIQKCKRPAIIFGAGIYLSKAQKEAKHLLNALEFPLVPTWAAADFLASDHPLSVGTFGTHGTRYANNTVQNADLILSIGSRLDTKATGTPITTFAREAKKIVVDIDIHELNKFEKFGLVIEENIQCDAKIFLQALNEKIAKIKKPDISEWLLKISEWKNKYPICPSEYYTEKDVNPYVFVKSLSKECEEGDNIIIDTGCCVAWMMQAFDFKENQRLLHDWNNTAMGWAIPASIGAAFEKKNQRIICVIGDGSLQMNIQELSTIIQHQLPIKIFILNNGGYSMIRQTQDQWLDSKYEASSKEGGLVFPNFIKISEAYGFKTVNITSNQGMNEYIKETLSGLDPVICNVEIPATHRVIPLAKFGYPNEDQEPLLSRSEFFKNMIIEPLAVSKKV